jgi:protoheme IX farnesyltransferase
LGQASHFLAIAWMYREEYGRAGLKMLPVIDETGTATARQMLLYTLALVPVTVAPFFLQEASVIAGVGTFALGVVFLRFVWGFALQPSFASARAVMRASLIYLPCVLGLLLLDRYVMTVAFTA